MFWMMNLKCETRPQFFESFDFFGEDHQFAVNIGNRELGKSTDKQRINLKDGTDKLQPELFSFKLEEERRQQQQQQQQQLELRETFEGNLEQQTGIQSQFERKIQPQEFGQHFNNFSPTVRQNSGSPSAFRGLEMDSSAARGVFERIRNSLVKGERFMVESQQATSPLTTTTKSLMTLTTSSRTTSTKTSTISTTTIATTEKSATEKPNERI